MSGFRYAFGGVAFDDMAGSSAAMFLEDLLEPCGGAGEMFEDLLDSPSAGGGEMFEDLLDSPSGVGGGEMFEDLLDSPDSGGGAMEDVQDLSTDSFLKPGNYTIDLNASPGTPVQPPPPVAIISNSCSPQANPCTVLEARTLVSVLEAPTLRREERAAWVANVTSILPNDILCKAPRKRGQGKYFASGQKYKPCSWEKFIERVNEKVSAGKLKVISKPQKRRRQIRAPEDVTDPVVVVLQAQAEIYGEHFNAANFWEWP